MIISMIAETITETTISESATPVSTISQIPPIKPTNPIIANNKQTIVIINGLFAMKGYRNYGILKKPLNDKKIIFLLNTGILRKLNTLILNEF